MKKLDLVGMKKSTLVAGIACDVTCYALALFTLSYLIKRREDQKEAAKKLVENIQV